MSDLERQVRRAVRHFWATRQAQAARQGTRTGNRDQGSRSAVTGGAQMDGFVELVRGLIVDNGLPAPSVHYKRRIELPGFFRAEKQWDLLVVLDDRLLATIEFKSQVGPSFGNNFNNRTEEALGSATDLWTAYREGAFKPSAKPWLGYIMLLEETPASTAPVKVREPHFPVFPEFRQASYAQRYEILLTKLVRERMYDGACLLLSGRKSARTGTFREPALELSFRSFASSLLAHTIAAAKMR